MGGGSLSLLRLRCDCGRVAPRMRMKWIVVAVSVSLVGCKTYCRQLSEKLCDCASTTTEKNSCLQGISTREANSPPTPEDEVLCEGLLPGCDCRLLDTAQGKERCGWAVGADAGL